MAGTTTKVDKTTLSEENNVSTALHGESVNLGLDVNALNGVGLEPSNVDLNVEVADATRSLALGQSIDSAKFTWRR